MPKNWLRTAYVAVVIIAATMVLPCRAADDHTDAVKLRQGIPNHVRILAAGEPQTRQMYFGGGIMADQGASRAGHSFRHLAQRAFATAFPKASVRHFNAVITGTGSWLGAFRTRTEVINSWIPLGLVVMEFASEDTAEPPARVQAAVEGIVRQVRAARPQAEIVFVYALGPGDLDIYLKEQTPAIVAAYETVAEHYGIPSVHAAAAAARLVAAGKLASEDIVGRERAPSDAVHAAYAEVFAEFVRHSAAGQVADSEVRHAMPAPLSPQPLAQATIESYERATLSPGWLDWQQSPLKRFLHVVHGTKPGAEMAFRFRGETIGIYDVLTPDSADLEVAVDDGPWRRLAATAVTTPRERALLVAENLVPDQEHVLKIRLPTDTPPERSAHIAAFLVNGQAVWDNPHAGMTPLERCDAIYATIEPINYTPPPERFKFLPKTRQRLNDGPELTMVMLGDSIVNDTARSAFEHLIMRRYPQCRITKVVSVRGSTGCWFYKEEGQVQEYVVKHRPDLLMIGGISHRNDIASIQEVIHQVRAALPEIEIMLMTGPFGNFDPKKAETWLEVTPSDGDSYEARLRRLAEEERAAFLDLRGAWGKYLRDSRHATGAFMRDVVHANARGEQILGYILDRFFAPDDAQP